MYIPANSENMVQGSENSYYIRKWDLKTTTMTRRPTGEMDAGD